MTYHLGGLAKPFCGFLGIFSGLILGQGFRNFLLDIFNAGGTSQDFLVVCTEIFIILEVFLNIDESFARIPRAVFSRWSFIYQFGAQ